MKNWTVHKANFFLLPVSLPYALRVSGSGFLVSQNLESNNLLNLCSLILPLVKLKQQFQAHFSLCVWMGTLNLLIAFEGGPGRTLVLLLPAQGGQRRAGTKFW